MIVAKFFIVAAIGYLLGSIPFGLLIARRMGKVDVREYGSGKMGTTNVLRTAGGKAAGLVFLLDLVKGMMAVLVAGVIFGGDYLVVGSGHWGVLAALFPPVAIFGGEIFVISAGLSKFVSLASIAAAASTYAILVPLTIYNKFPIEYLIYALIGTVVIIIMHRDNISRLLAGKERKLGEKAKLKS
ncbi:glycerol-3-phosphate acyltransferase [Chloroflexota bacterium]